MTDIEEHEMNEAAMSLVVFSEQVYDFDLPPGDDVDQLKPLEEKILDCVESILDFSELLSHSDFEKSRTCSDVVAQGLPSPLRSKLKKHTQSNSSHKCKKCGKIFGCFQALGGHQRLHRSIKGQLLSKKDDNSLFDSLEAKKTVSQESQPSNFEVSQEEKILDCVDLKQDFSELLPLNIKLKKRPESSSSYKCSICGKTFGCFQALGGHKTLHRSIKGKFPRSEDDNSLSHSSEQPSSFEVSEEEKMLHCVETKQDFSELVSHSGFNKSTKTSFSALLSTSRSKLQEKTQSNCQICGKIFRCSQALGSHQRIHRPISEKLVRKRKYTEDYNSLSDSLEAKKIVSQPLSFEVSEDEKMLHCVDESKQDFSKLFSHSDFGKSNSCSQTRFSPLPFTLRSKSHSSYKCKLCGKSFGCSEALVGHKILHMSIKRKLARKKEETEDGNSLFGLTDSEASKFVSQPSSFEISQQKKILHCVESKQDFSELLSHSCFDIDKSIS